MNINKRIKHMGRQGLLLVIRRGKFVTRPAKKIVRRIKKYANLEVTFAFHLLSKSVKKQLRQRPRIRLVTATVFTLAVLYLASGRAIDYIKPKEAEIKINGQSVLLADKLEVEKLPPAELEQNVSAKLSPFKFRQPVSDGVISQGYSSYHRANDIAAAFGSPIHPLGPGRVIYAGRMSDGHGNTVIIDHGDGLETLYAHMNVIDVAVGNQVSEDTEIGTIGLTGHTTGPHVHVEVTNNGVQIDPASVLPD